MKSNSLVIKKLLLLFFTTSFFTTVLQAQEYCTVSTDHLGINHILSFATTGGYTNIQNSNMVSAAYSDYNPLAVSQLAGGEIYFMALLSNGCSFAIYIDWNDSHSFDDSGELVWAVDDSGWGIVPGFFTVPLGTAAGAYRMRIRSADSYYVTGPCGNVEYGEAEDYTIEIIPSTTCFFPVSLTARMASPTTVDLGWTVPESTQSFGYEYAVTTSNIPPGSGLPASEGSITGHGVIPRQLTTFMSGQTAVMGLTANGVPSLFIQIIVL